MINRLTPGIFSLFLHSFLLGGILLISWKKGAEEKNPIYVIWMEKKIEKKLSQVPLKQNKQEKNKNVKLTLAPQKVEVKNLQQT